MYYDPTGHWRESDKNLARWKQDLIVGLTDAYYDETDNMSKEEAHAIAQYLRSMSGTGDSKESFYDKFGDSIVGLNTNNEFYDYVSNTLEGENDYFSADEWEKASSLYVYPKIKDTDELVYKGTGDDEAIRNEIDKVFSNQYMPEIFIGEDIHLSQEQVSSVYNDVKRLSQFIGGTGEGFDIVLQHRNRIAEVAEERKISSELIAGIIYKEVMTSTPFDYTDEWRLKFGDVYPIIKALPKIGKNFQDASIGLGQIFVSTVRRAERAGFVEKTLSDWEIRDKLSDPYHNIDYIGAVLQTKAVKLQIGNDGRDLTNLNQDEIWSLLKSYNGAGVYADKVSEYLPILKKVFE